MNAQLDKSRFRRYGFTLRQRTVSRRRIRRPRPPIVWVETARIDFADTDAQARSLYPLGKRRIRTVGSANYRLGLRGSRSRLRIHHTQKWW